MLCGECFLFSSSLSLLLEVTPSHHYRAEVFREGGVAQPEDVPHHHAVRGAPLRRCSVRVRERGVKGCHHLCRPRTAKNRVNLLLVTTYGIPNDQVQT